MSSAVINQQLQKLVSLDARLVEAAKSIKVLSNLAWPPDLAQKFLDSWNKGNPILPEVSYTGKNYSSTTGALKEIMRDCDQHHPIGNYIFKTAESYCIAAAMLECLGTAAFTEISSTLYGTPRETIGNSGISILEAAEHFLQTTASFTKSIHTTEADHCVLPSVVADELSRQIAPVFTNHPVEVVIDNTLASKAAAGARRIRIRGGTCFSWADIPQLVHHEAFVHTLTMLNGREQPNLKSLGLGAPRTTRAQEGLALFAELITTSIDLNRLRRIALRVKAVHLAMEGANFIEVFKFFLDSGQDELESFHSTMRIFRGGDVRGRIVYTKDVVYLEGLVFIERFLLKAIEEGRTNYPNYLFSGRLALSDVLALDEYFANGFIAPPLYAPSWIKNRACLAAFLLYSSFTNRIDIGRVRLEHFERQEI
ncbi:MAG: flavohemoglobin expression-modulating QEGLA motif protein [Oligoflexia bacterium]|nr:flavohemoglobin expression-modulating QEGLA motif protein [Oligoflexia bacterium]